MERKRAGLSAYALKLIALVSMTLDHIGEFIHGVPFFFRMIGRIAAPLFFFTLAFSFQNTSSRKRFLFRLYIASAVTELIKIAVFYIDRSSKDIVVNNMFSTMFLSVLMAVLLEDIVIFFKSANYAVVLCCAAAVVIMVIWPFVSLNLPDTVLWFITAFAPAITRTEGGVPWFILGAGMCLFASKRRLLIIFYSIYCVLELAGTILFAGAATLLYNIQWMMVFTLPFFFLYNGQRGKGRKWFFYLYYPLHIWVIYAFSRMIS